MLYRKKVEFQVCNSCSQLHYIRNSINLIYENVQSCQLENTESVLSVVPHHQVLLKEKLTTVAELQLLQRSEQWAKLKQKEVLFWCIVPKKDSKYTLVWESSNGLFAKLYCICFGPLPKELVMAKKHVYCISALNIIKAGCDMTKCTDITTAYFYVSLSNVECVA